MGAIATRDDAEFARLATAIDHPELADDERFATRAARQAHEDELEVTVAAWTAARTRDEAVAELVAAGVSAAAVRTMDEVAASEHLAAREFFVRLPRPEAGTRAVAGPPWRATRHPMRPVRPAPTHGQHTVEVPRDVLGLAPAEIADLAARGVVG